MEWKEVTLGEITNLVIDYRGKTPLKLGSSWSDSGYRALSAKNIKTGQIVAEDSIRFVDEELYRKWMKDEVKKGDILITSEAPFGQIYYWDSDEKIVLSQRLFDVRLNDEVCHKYVYYFMTSHRYQKDLEGRATGTTVTGLRQPELLKSTILLPPLSAQRSISSILSSLDRKIELNNKINADLEEMAQTIFKNWFVDFEPFKDGKFVDSELGMIPEGWKVGTLGDITKNKSAKVKERNDVKVLSPVTTGELVLSEEYFTKQVFSSSIAKYKIVNKGDFAYNPARVNIGSLGRNEFDFDGCVSPVYVVFSVLDGYENYFDLFRKTDFFKDSVASLAIGGVRQSLSYDDLSSIEVIIPSENAVEEFNNLYNQMKKTIKANKLENSRLSTLRDTLLPRLMSGELEVPE